MSTLSDIQTVVSNIGLNALGIAAPLLSVRWSSTDPVEEPETLSLRTTGNWVAPAAGVLFVQSDNRLLRVDGSPLPAGAAIFRLHPHVYLRIARLVRAVIEGGNDGLPIRPVPLYFAYQLTGQVNQGAFEPGDSLGLDGAHMTAHDARGLAIDPVVVAEMLDTLIDSFGVLEDRPLLSATATPQASRQIHTIGALGSGGVRIHLIDPHGRPGERTQLQGLEDVAASAGLFKMTSGTTSITRVSSAPADLRLGAATNGKLGTSFAIPNPSKTLRRDFLRVIVTNLKPFLIGEVPSSDPAAAVEPAPLIRHNETVTFSFNGNAIFGAANEILSNTPDDSLVVSPAITGDFALPANAADAQSQWPAFPAGLPAANDPPPATLRDSFNPAATFVSGTEADVALTLNGLSAGHAVRVYNRLFLPDAREGRGDGAGAAVSSGATSVVLRLKDPFGLVRPGLPTVLPTNPILHVDVVVVNTKKKARVYGNVAVKVGPPAAPPAITPETNLLGSAADRGVSTAGILGLPAAPLLSGPIDTNQQIIDLIRGLGSEGTPRDAPRLPTMARRDAMVASDKAGAWKGLVSGAQFVGSSRNSLQRLGSPGSPGGVESHSISAQTSGGQLAYDIARAALRRTSNLVSRSIRLADSRWAEPSAATAGTISGAVMQTISPITETPELSVMSGSPSGPPGRVNDEYKRESSASIHGRRDAFRALLRVIKSARELIYIEGPAFAPTAYGADVANDLVSVIKTRLGEIPSLRVILCLSKNLDYGPGYEPFAAREFARRKEAVEKLIGRQQLFTMNSNFTASLDLGQASDAFLADFATQRTISTDSAVTVIRKGSRWRLEDRTNGRMYLINSDGGPLSIFEEETRVVAFHPIGFPGRALRLSTNLVVVDDLWAMIGSSTIRRRGLTFDGGADLVLFDNQIREGRGAAIMALRRQAMAVHLGATDPKGDGPNPTFVRLADAHSAFDACRELLALGGEGLIEPLFDGRIQGVTPIPPSAFPSDDVADPDGRKFDFTVNANVTQPLLGMIAAASVTGARP